MSEVGDIKLTKNNRGNNKLCHNGFYYSKNKQRKNMYYWICDEYKSSNCQGFLTTIKKGDEFVIKSQKEHNHWPNPEKKRILDAIWDLKATCQENNSSPRLLVDDKVNRLTMVSYYDLPTRTALTQRLTRVRRLNMKKVAEMEQEQEVEQEVECIEEDLYY